jgi:hypothetical protein
MEKQPYISKMTTNAEINRIIEEMSNAPIETGKADLPINKYYVLLFQGKPFEPGCYSVSGECCYFDTEQKARDHFNSLSGCYSKKELGFTGESGEEFDWIDEHDIYSD